MSKCGNFMLIILTFQLCKRKGRTYIYVIRQKDMLMKKVNKRQENQIILYQGKWYNDDICFEVLRQCRHEYNKENNIEYKVRRHECGWMRNIMRKYWEKWLNDKRMVRILNGRNWKWYEKDKNRQDKGKN